MTCYICGAGHVPRQPYYRLEITNLLIGGVGFVAKLCLRCADKMRASVEKEKAIASKGKVVDTLERCVKL